MNTAFLIKLKSKLTTLHKNTYNEHVCHEILPMHIVINQNQFSSLQTGYSSQLMTATNVDVLSHITVKLSLL